MFKGNSYDGKMKIIDGKIMAWKCPECNSLNNDSIISCTCGYEAGMTTAPRLKLLQTTSAEDTEKAQSTEISEVHPWVRFGARVIDYHLNAFNLFFTLGIVAPQTFEAFNLMLGNFFYSIIFSMLFIFIWVYIEAQLLCTWGTTPGKWVLGIVLRDPNGQKLSFSNALKRSFSVWLRGIGIGLPLISLFTLINSHDELTKEGTTSWDRDGGFVVSHQKIGPFRITLAILLFIWVAFEQITARLGGF